MRQIAIPLTLALTLMLLVATTLSAAGDVAAGKAMFAKKCSTCHGAAGEGKDAIAKMMKVEMKPLGSQEVQAKSDSDLAKVIKDGTGKMKPVADLSDKDIQDLIAYMRTLAKK
jgi:mono/diheme cytochrome c family protein